MNDKSDLEEGRDLTPDRITKFLPVDYSTIPKGYVSIKGYLADEHKGLRRVFCDDTFMRWIDVKTDDIRFRIHIPANERDARSVLYIRRWARVITCHVGFAHELDDRAIDPSADGVGHDQPPWH
jgi:hypothetical protein